MIIKYNIEQLKRILRDFSCITGLALAIHDTEFNNIYTYIYRESAFCQAVHTAEGGRNRCYCSDRDLLKKSRESKKFVSHFCHAGVLDSAVPIIKNGIIVGHILVGRIRTAEDLSEHYEKLSWLDADLDELNQKYRQIPYYNEDQIHAIADMISYLLFENAIEIEYNPFIKSVTDFIDTHLQEELSVARLCASFGVSKNFLYKSFNESLGRTVNQYVIDQRINKAKHLLKSTDDPVYSVAEQCGFSDGSYFCRLFKKQTGYSPSEYRDL